MRRSYIACGVSGGVIVVAIVTYRVWAYFHTFAVSADRHDVQLNVLFVFGLGIGIVLVPVGVGLGILAGALISRGVEWLQRRRPETLANSRGNSQVGEASWVTRHREQ